MRAVVNIEGQQLGTDRRLGVFVDGALRTGGYYPNHFDKCLDMDYAYWCQILDAGGLEKLCLPLGHRPYEDRPWVKMPDGGRAFAPQGLSLVSDVTEGVETTLLSMEVPFGYDGVITYVVAGILPTAAGSTNFTEGSGQITWRLKASNRHLRDWGRVLTSRGSFIDPSPTVNAGLRVYSRNLIELTVTLSATSGLNPTSNLVAMIMGWVYPR